MQSPYVKPPAEAHSGEPARRNPVPGGLPLPSGAVARHSYINPEV